MSNTAPSRPRLFTRGSFPEYQRIQEILRKETVGGSLLLVATAVALVLANSPWAGAYFTIRDLEFGYEPWHLRLSVGEWAADGLLAIFFFLAGLELKREFVAGDLRDPGRAVVPVTAAVGGVIVPAVVFASVNSGDPDALRGWAIPTATDIAFAVAVLAVIGSHLPGALRLFLLTLAVVDDLLAIGIIAFFYSDDVQLPPLLLAALPLAVFAYLTHKYSWFFGARPIAAWAILLPIGIVVWALVHASGIHATVAGVLLGFAVPVKRSPRSGGPQAGPGLAETFEHRFRPISTVVAVPLFAFFSAGVALGGVAGFAAALTDPIAIGIMVALVVGKPVGILFATWLVTTTTRARLDSDLTWIDLLGMAILAGVGFTVSLLVAELAYGHGSVADDHAKVAILTGSLVAAVLAAALLVARNRRYRQIAQRERVDGDGDGVPDVFAQG